MTGAAYVLGDSRRAALAGIAVAAAAGALAGADPSLSYRPLFAGAVALNLAIAVVLSPRIAVLGTFAFLPVMAFVRRVLIDDAGWASRDPLLLVGPGVALLLVCRFLIVERRPIPSDWTSRLIMALLAVAVLGTLNPSGGGLRVGVGGLLFLGVPLVWYLIGQQLGDRALVTGLMKITVGLGVLNAAYGFAQSEIGLPPWDDDWVDVSGYYALFVGGTVRPFGTFSSATEYLMYLSTSIVFALVLWRRGGNRLWLLPLPLLAAALFFGSGRTALALAVVALVAMATLGSARPKRAAAVLTAAAAAISLALFVVAPRLSESDHPLVSHQAAGLADPLDPESSTLRIHWDLFRGGIEEGLRRPLGLGTGVTNLGADLGDISDAKRKVTAGVFENRPNLETDIDVSNVFLGLGALGGLLYVGVMGTVLWRTVRFYLLSRDPLVLGVAGLLVATLGQWLAGGHYALAPLTWLLVGCVARQALAERVSRTAP